MLSICREKEEGKRRRGDMQRMLVDLTNRADTDASQREVCVQLGRLWLRTEGDDICDLEERSEADCFFSPVALPTIIAQRG